MIIILLECCLELAVLGTDNQRNGTISKFTGHYLFRHKPSDSEQIRNGLFIYERNDKKKYIFKNENGTWSVSILLTVSISKK